jgi:hypothetical protein
MYRSSNDAGSAAVFGDAPSTPRRLAALPRPASKKQKLRTHRSRSDKADLVVHYYLLVRITTLLQAVGLMTSFMIHVCQFHCVVFQYFFFPTAITYCTQVLAIGNSCVPKSQLESLIVEVGKARRESRLRWCFAPDVMNLGQILERRQL